MHRAHAKGRLCAQVVRESWRIFQRKEQLNWLLTRRGVFFALAAILGRSRGLTKTGRQVASSLSTCWRQQGWARYIDGEHGALRRSVEFGWSEFSGGSEVQRAAYRAGEAYKLKAPRDENGSQFFEALIVRWLRIMWRQLGGWYPSSSREEMVASSTKRTRLAGTEFTK
eukprot:3190179-Pleurochrysis_carterae.AAC.3